MAILKCKMCGGDLNFEEGITVVECEYCGTKQTVPNVDNEKKIALFGRANRLRYACEFDKASGIYESIVADFPEESEAYWGLVLCKYGIEYVDDPATGKKIPTCHRSSFESVMEDDNFEQVLENADPLARSVYREEAKQIEELRRGIIEVSGKEEPYDIFICYKETTENGERTIDSVIAQDVYQELTAKGYRVFFSRITLEDKLGQEYEPYIFAALNSAKIMLAFGTDYEYYNAVWVKNEWSRFLQLIAKGEKKTLIPCYKNLDAYDMPKEFAKLQAQDMGKVGAVQDLLRGIEKLLSRNETESAKETIVVQQPLQTAPLASLLKRAFMYLEDGEWKNATNYCNRVLDIEPENADAYVGLLMAELEIRKEQELANQTKRLDENKHFIKALRFSTGERRNVLEDYEKANKEYCEEQQRIAEERKREEEENRQKNIQQLAKKREVLAVTAGLMDADENCTVALKWDKRVVVRNHYSQFDDDRRKESHYIWDDDLFWVSHDHIFPDRDIIAVAAGCDHVVGLKLDGTVIAAGNNSYNQCAVLGWEDIVAIAASENHTIGLKSNGTVVATGDNSYNQCAVSGWKDIVAVATCKLNTIGLRANGTVILAGNSPDTQCNISDWNDIVAIATGENNIIALKSDGSVCVLGKWSNLYKISAWTDIVAVAAGYDHILGLKPDGTVVATGAGSDRIYCAVAGWENIVAIVAAAYLSVGLKSNGTMVMAGDAYDINKYRVNDLKLFTSLQELQYRKEEELERQQKAIEEKQRRREEELERRRKAEEAKQRWREEELERQRKAEEEKQRRREEELERRRKAEEENLRWEAEEKERKRKEEEERKKYEESREQTRRRVNNLCQHCGGKFKGLFNKCCSVCGKPKDY